MASNIKVLEQFGAIRRNLGVEISAQIKNLPFGPRQVHMLRTIDKNGEISLGKLAEAVATDPGTVSRSIAQMIKIGLVEKRQSNDDGRLWTVRIANKGQKYMPQIHECYNAVAEALVAGLSAAEREQLGGLFAKINLHFEKSEVK